MTRHPPRRRNLAPRISIIERPVAPFIGQHRHGSFRQCDKCCGKGPAPAQRIPADADSAPHFTVVSPAPLAQHRAPPTNAGDPRASPILYHRATDGHERPTSTRKSRVIDASPARRRWAPHAPRSGVALRASWIEPTSGCPSQLSGPSAPSGRSGSFERPRSRPSNTHRYPAPPFSRNVEPRAPVRHERPSQERRHAVDGRAERQPTPEANRSAGG